MRNRLLGAVGLLLTAPVLAAPWTFGERIEVAPAGTGQTFQHIESAGRKNIAVSGDRVGVVWEDNRSGTPQVYVAFKSRAASAFDGARRVSDELPAAAYEPVIVALGDERFLLAWEQDNAVWARAARPDGLEPAIKLSRVEAGQITLASGARGTHAAWAQQQGRYRQIVTAALTIPASNKPLRAGPVRPVDAVPPTADQLYPTLAVTGKGVVLAWEDRRRGHTVLLTSFADHGQAFGRASELNEVVEKSALWGKGSGVTRVSLAAFGNEQVGATWMDKRNFSSGYDIYAALSGDGGRRFDKNQLVQDSFGENFSQWHPAIAGAADGTLAVAWDDDRDGTSDIQLSWKTANGWSDDLVVAPAAGAGQQAHPSIALDDQGNLHLVWLDFSEKGQATRLFYALGKRPPAGD